MSKEAITRWLDNVAETTKLFNSLPNYDKEIALCRQCEHSFKGETMPYVHLYKGIRKIATDLDFEVNVLYEDDDEACIFFIWKDVMFIELEDKED